MTLFAWILLVASVSAHANEWTATPRNGRDLQRIQSQVQRLLPRVKPATVVVLGDGSGSGVIISRTGLALTAGHVCGKAGTPLKVLLPDGRLVSAKSLGAVKRADAGLIQLRPGRYPHVPIANPSEERVAMGTWCLALGHPGGWDGRRGVVIRLGRILSRSKDTLRSDCKLVGGDSGGPLFDLRGRVIGVHSRISRKAHQNYHVPMETYRRHWPEHFVSPTARRTP